jgi:hypothetical protein
MLRARRRRERDATKSTTKMTGPSPSASRDAMRVTAAFLFALVALELVVRANAARLDAHGMEFEVAARAAYLRTQRQVGVLVLGDSTAREGIATPELAQALGDSAVNAGVASGSGIVAATLAQAVTWRPRHVVYAGAVIEVSDSWMLTSVETRSVHLTDTPLWQPEAWRHVTPEVVLSSLSDTYARRSNLLLALRGRRYETLVGDAYLANPASLAAPPAHLQATAHELLGVWLQEDWSPSGLRRLYLERAMRAWSDGGATRTLIITPLTTQLQQLLDEHITRDVVTGAWLEVARSVDAALFDCRQAVPDAGFKDADHLIAPAAERQAVALGAWLTRAQPMPGCLRLR